MDWERLPRLGDNTLNRRGFVPLEPPGADVTPRMPVPGAGPARVPVQLPAPSPAAVTAITARPPAEAFPPPMVASGPTADPNALTPVLPKMSNVSDQAIRAANELTIRGGNSTKPFTRADLEAENPTATVRVSYPGSAPNYKQLQMLAPYMQATRPAATRVPTGADMIQRAYLNAVLGAARGIADPQKQLEFTMERLSSFMGKNPMLDMLRLQQGGGYPEE